MRVLEWLLGALLVLAAVLTRRPRRTLPAGVDAEDLAVGYERSDANVRVMLIGGLALLLALAIVFVAVSAFEVIATGLPVTLGRPPDLVNRLTPGPTPPPPRLENAEGEQYAAYRAAAEQQLSSYRWVDRQGGVVSIPIERAMDLVAQRGLPARTPSSARDDGTSAPSSASSGRVDESLGP
jgi:hypothetical protein